MGFAVSCEILFDKGEVCSIMRFMGSGRTTYGMIGDRSRQDPHGISNPVDSLIDVQKLVYGQWISEAALWVLWENAGRLIADNNCSLVHVDAVPLAHCLR